MMTYQVDFGNGEQKKKPVEPSPTLVSRTARMLALAHYVEQQIEHGHLRDLKMFGPKEWRNKHSEYGIRWRYVFSSGIPLSGQPFVYGIK